MRIPVVKAWVHLAWLLVALWPIHASRAAAAQWGQASAGVQLGVSVEERAFQVRERLPVSVQFTNSSTLPRFPVGPIHLTGKVTVVDERGQLVRRREELKAEAQAKAGQPAAPKRPPPPIFSAAIKPGGTLAYAVDLAREFALDQPGRYQVSAVAQVLGGMPFEPGSVTHSLTSGVVVVQIVSNAPPVAAVAAPAPPSAPTSPPVVKASPPAAPAPVVAAPVVPASPPPVVVATPSVPPPPAASARASFHYSSSLLMAGIFGVAALLVLYAMFKSDPR